MSYCRWSTDDFQCDLYVYADVGGGYTTHIARTRYKFKEPLPSPVLFDREHILEYMERHKKILKMCEEAGHELIALPYAGESYNLDKEQTIAKLEELRSLGYQFPEYVIPNIREDEESEQN